MRISLALLTLTVTVGILTGCDAISPSYSATTTITVEQARQIADGHITPITSLMPGSRLEPINSAADEVPCSDVFDGLPPGRIQVSRQYFVRGLDPINSIVDVAILDRFFLGRGFQPRAGVARKPNQLYYQNLADGYNASVLANDGVVSVGVASPCVWPSGHL